MKKWLQRHFIPHHSNDYKPDFWQKAAMGAMVLLVLLSFTVANIQALFWVSSDWLVSTILPAVIVSETNDERADDALGLLARSSTLDRAAQLKAEHMAANEYFAHFAPDGTSPWYFFGQVDYGFVHAGENLAIHFNDSSEVVEAWMDSPTHRANILNGDFTEIGIGVAPGTYEGYKTLYVVQLFGAPAAPAPTVAVAVPEPDPAPVVAAVSEEVLEETSLPEAVAGAEDEVVIETELVQEPVETVITQIVETDFVPTETEPASVEDESQTKPETTVVYSDLISTTTGATPASIDGTTANNAGSTEPAFAFATQPQMILQVLYVLIGLFVIGALILSVLIEIRSQHPVQLAYSVALLLLMYGLYSVHSNLLSGASIV